MSCRLIVGTVLLVLAASAAPPRVVAQQSAWRCPDPASLIGDLRGSLAHVRYLADDLLEGRAVGTRGERCAGEYIAAQFRALGLRPAGDGGTWFQAWMVRTGSAAGAGNAFALAGADGTPFALGEDWIPYGFSASTRVRAELMDAPGETAELGAGAAHGQLEGRALVIEGAAPHPHAAAPDAHRVGSSAAAMGAAALIVLLDGSRPLPSLAAERRAPLAIPVIAVRGAAADRVRAAAASGSPANLVTVVEPVRREARNVAALLPGTDPHGGQTLVIGAHYDHLGFGGAGSLSPNAVGEVHNGADDNASGTAVLIEAARDLAKGPRLAQNVLFIAFTGEERGLWGSAHYMEAPLLPLDGTIAMLNLDMVGRVKDDLLTVFGTGTAEEWTGVLDRANAATPSPLDLRYNSDGFGGSDHSSFYARGIPVLHFFSNTHPEYHRVEDDWELVNPEGMSRVTDLLVSVVREVLPTAGLASLTPVEGAGNPRGVAGPTDGSPARSGFRVRLGTIPDYSRESGGMGITGVREGSPAAQAGIKGGDIIVKFGDHDIEDVYGYMYALSEHEPGDEVEITVLRDGERMVFTVVLAAGGG
ncbi:MAG: M28 family peptidase [Gemmatimonadetes bacterium]|nr:M28 family peptidase [Gemmatimonadota bacterium]MYA41360.1 M28 family peptidase [Gemmatimonadota bacterium]MYJ10600.1 M28 family peptidase [Gemmatimonadota bacterium]